MTFVQISLAGLSRSAISTVMRVVLIAAKETRFAKTRLRARFPLEERRLLAEAMFRDVLAAALESRRAQGIALVTSDRTLLETARSAGVITIDEEYARGLNAAVAMATAALLPAGATTVATVLSDIPLVTGADIDNALEHGEEPGVVLVPSSDGTGTNIIVRSPADAIATRFGRASLKHHVEDCDRRRLRCQILPLPRAALDLDVIGDLQGFLRAGADGHTANQLARLGLHHG